jgi:hypothetical protein
MGQVGFLVPRRECLPAEALERAYLAGLDDLPWETRVTATSNGLSADRSESDSGYFHILWRVPGRGAQVLGTTTVREREAPYNLAVELARGSLNRLRNQLAGWEMAGLAPPAAVAVHLAQAMEEFAAAATNQQQPAAAADRAQQAIVATLAGSDLLAAGFAEHAIRLRKSQSAKLTMLYGVRLDEKVPEPALTTSLASAFNSAIVPLEWKEIESREGKWQWSLSDSQIAWCAANELRIIGGPVLDLDRQTLPDWLYLWEGDFDNIIAMATQQIQAVVARYKGRINLWHCAANINTVDTLGLTEEQALRLAVRSIETVRNADPKAPVLVSFNQPWGEYLGREERDLTPVHYADALVRADLGVSGIGLELNLGSGPRSSLPRDALELSRQLDRWSTLGLPLVILLTIPSGGDSFTPDIQRAWLDSHLQLLLAKAAVHGIFWNQLIDAPSGERAGRGLCDPSGQLTGVFRSLADFRRRQGF